MLHGIQQARDGRESERPLVRATRSLRYWVGWLLWLAGAVCAAVVAPYWQTPTGPQWAPLVWLLPVALGVALVFTALWTLLGSRRVGTPSRTGQKPARRRSPRDPNAHLHELRRSREYWAIMLRLPPEGGCDVAQRARWQVFDLYRAPSLPLPGCANARCRCGYSGLKERRRRDVLPAGLERDRRATSMITYRPRVAPEPETSTVGSPLAEMLRT